jgi:hypothetical protein
VGVCCCFDFFPIEFESIAKVLAVGNHFDHSFPQIVRLSNVPASGVESMDSPEHLIRPLFVFGFDHGFLSAFRSFRQ